MNMSTMPFTHPTMHQAIQNINSSIITHFREIAARLDLGELPPELICIHPEANGCPNLTLPQCREVIKDIKNKRPGFIQWNDIGPYNMIQCAIMNKIHEFLLAARALQLETGESLSHTSFNKIQNMGKLALHSSTALATKYIWICKRAQTHGGCHVTANRNEWFMGNVSVTSPVKKFFAKILHTKNPSIHQATQVTFELAAECNMDPVSINTAMWLIGQEI